MIVMNDNKKIDNDTRRIISKRIASKIEDKNIADCKIKLNT